MSIQNTATMKESMFLSDVKTDSLFAFEKTSNIQKINKIVETVNLSDPQKDNIIKIGKLFEDEIKERVGYDFDSYHSARKIKKIGFHNQQFLTEICSTGAKLENVELLNPDYSIDEFNEVTALFPYHAIKILDYVNIRIGSISQVFEDSGREDEHENEKGTVGIFFRGPKKSPYFYIGINNSSRYPKKQIYAHELTHAIQKAVKTMNKKENIVSEEGMFFDEVTNLVSERNGEKTKRGFPHPHMSEPSKNEILSYATEDLLYSSEESFLYRRERHPNSCIVRQWAIGYWIVINKQLSMYIEQWLSSQQNS